MHRPPNSIIPVPAPAGLTGEDGNIRHWIQPAGENQAFFRAY